MTEALEQIIEENAKARADLMAAVDAIPAARQLETAFGEWSVRDVLVHIARWQDGWAHFLELLAKGERPVVPGYEGDDDAYNAESVRLAEGQSWERVMGTLRAARQRHDAAIRGLSALDADRYAEGRSARRLSDAAGHDREHIEDIAAWRRQHSI